MGGSNSWRQQQSGADWMRDMEKRLLHEERRPGVRTAADLLGPGVAPFSVLVIDWNAAETAFNGFFHSEPGAFNTPGSTRYWMGISQATQDGYGFQRVIEYRANPTDAVTNQEWIRRFSTPTVGSSRSFTPWVSVSGGGGAAPNYAWVTVVDPASDSRPVVEHVMWVGGTTKPTNMGTGDLWVKAVG